VGCGEKLDGFLLFLKMFISRLSFNSALVFMFVLNADLDSI
jgi:hypothetical protein